MIPLVFNLAFCFALSKEFPISFYFENFKDKFVKKVVIVKITKFF